jgi:hypothetical protein
MALSIPLGLILRKKLLNNGAKPIDNSIRCMVACMVMNENVQAKLSELQEKGWTLANIARELGQATVTVESWKAGKRSPANLKSVITSLGELLKRKRIPKKKIYINDKK